MFAVAAIGQRSTFATLMSTPAAKLWSCLGKSKHNFRTSNVFQKPSYVVLKLNSPPTKLLSSIRLRYFHWWWPAAKICLELSQVNCQASLGFEFVPFTGAIVNIMMILMMIRDVGVKGHCLEYKLIFDPLYNLNNNQGFFIAHINS